MSEERIRIRGGAAPTPVGSSATQEQDEGNSSRFKRTFTIGGLVGAGATPSQPPPAAADKPKVRSTTMGPGNAILPDPAVVKVPAQPPGPAATTRTGRTNTLTGPPSLEDMKGVDLTRAASVGVIPRPGASATSEAGSRSRHNTADSPQAVSVLYVNFSGS